MRLDPNHPRPTLQRPGWRSLEGHWDFALSEAEAPGGVRFDRKILVPFPPLSIVIMLKLQPTTSLVSPIADIDSLIVWIGIIGYIFLFLFLFIILRQAGALSGRIN